MNKKRKTFTAVICILLAVLMVLSLILAAVPALAVSQDEIDRLQEKAELLERQAEEQQKTIEELGDSKSRFLDRKLALDAQIKLNKDSIAVIEEQIQLYDNLIAEKETELLNATETEREQSQQLRARMRAMEEGGSHSYAEVIFEAENLSDLLSRLADITDIMHYDKNLESSYIQTREDVETLMAEYEDYQAIQQEKKAELDQKEAQLAAQIEAAFTLIASIDELAEDAEAEYAAIAADEERILKELDELSRKLAEEQEAARLAALAAQQAAQNRPNNGGQIVPGADVPPPKMIPGGGYVQPDAGYVPDGVVGPAPALPGNPGSITGNSGLIWPTDSNYITSHFGGRDAPTAGASTNHGGLDIGAAAGTPIYAAASGTVELARPNGGYGNCVFIDHGAGTSTVYAHMSDYIVNPGQYVTQGQIIGYVGSTGIATGPHLHYEVRVDGTRTDPSQYYDQSNMTYSPTA